MIVTMVVFIIPSCALSHAGIAVGSKADITLSLPPIGRGMSTATNIGAQSLEVWQTTISGRPQADIRCRLVTCGAADGASVCRYIII
jgi:hypothetical protein